MRSMLNLAWPKFYSFQDTEHDEEEVVVSHGGEESQSICGFIRYKTERADRPRRHVWVYLRTTLVTSSEESDLYLFIIQNIHK
jgi:hypothetical protein